MIYLRKRRNASLKKLYETLTQAGCPALPRRPTHDSGRGDDPDAEADGGKGLKEINKAVVASVTQGATPVVAPYRTA
ncbi:MAG: hypothetical protein OXF02_05230 [Simkaniaceae bacterium]|nr:hypothetical protein [Simkaniaceae bacterium]